MGILDAPSISRTDEGFETLRTIRSSALRNYWAALGARATTAVNIMFLGDSKTEGQGASVIGKRWMDQLRDDLRTKYQPAGVTGGVGYVPAWYAISTPASPSPRFTYAGVANTDYTLSQGNGLGKRIVQLNTVTGVATLTFTGTSIDLLFTKMNAAANTVSIVIDGGATFTYTDPRTSGQPTVSGGKWNSVASGPGALAAGSHTVTITRASGAPNLEGAMIYYGDESSGIRVWDASHFGYRSQDFVVTAGQGWIGAVGLVAPHLVVVTLGTNDYGTGITSAAFATNIASLITLLRTQAANTSIMLVAMDERPATGSQVEAWSNYVAVLKAAALADTGAVGGGSGVCVLDLTKRMVRGDLDTLALHSDQTHYSDKGDRMVADFVLSYLDPR